MVDFENYFKVAKNYINKASNAQKKNIIDASMLACECMDDDGIVQLVGVNHGREFAMELGYRAGGLMPFHQFNIRDLALRGHIDEETLNNPEIINNEGLAQKWIDIYNIDKNDMYLFSSDDGCEPLLIELARIVKNDNRKVIVVVPLEKVRESISKHSKGYKITDFADVIIDLGVDGDTTALDINGVQLNQVSTIVGNVIAQMMTAEMYRHFKQQNKECPVLLSANVKGADVHNRALAEKYLGRWNS